MSTINQRIAQVVEHSGLTKSTFAERINLSQPYLSQICNGSRAASDRTLNDICREFSVDPLWLRTGEGEMIRPMSRELQIHAYLSELMGGSRTAAEEAFISTMARLPSQFWPMVEQALDTLLEEYSKSKKDKE